MFNMLLAPFYALGLVFSPPVSAPYRRHHVLRQRRQFTRRHGLTNHQWFKHNGRQCRTTDRHLGCARQFSINGQAIRRRVTQARRVQRVNVLTGTSINLTYRRAANARPRVLFRQPNANSSRLSTPDVLQRQGYLGRHGLVFLTNRPTKHGGTRQCQDKHLEVGQLLK